MPAVRSTAVDKNGKYEQAVTEMVLNGPGEDLRAMLGMKNVCMGRRLPSGLLLWWTIAAAACVLTGATTVHRNQEHRFYFRRVDEAIQRTAVTPIWSLKEVSYSVTLGSGEYQWEHADVRSDEHQYRIPAISMRAGAWRIFNRRRTVSKGRKVPGK